VTSGRLARTGRWRIRWDAWILRTASAADRTMSLASLRFISTQVITYIRSSSYTKVGRVAPSIHFTYAASYNTLRRAFGRGNFYAFQWRVKDHLSQLWIVQPVNPTLDKYHLTKKQNKQIANEAKTALYSLVYRGRQNKLTGSRRHKHLESTIYRRDMIGRTGDASPVMAIKLGTFAVIVACVVMLAV